MATLATNVKWGSSPTNTFDFSYEKKREGAIQYYKVTVSCDPCTGASYFGYPIYLQIKLDGTKKASKTLKAASPSQWSSALKDTTGWLEVPTKTDGTTTLAIRVYSGLGSSRDKTYSYTLPIDPATSKIGATDANIESTSTITITKYDANFTTTVSYKAAGQSGFTAIWTKQAHTSYGWTVPSSLYALIPNKKEIEITLQCETYSGSTLIGTETCTILTTTAPSKCSPSVSVSAVVIDKESTNLTGNNKTIISGVSKLQVVTTATAKNSATITGIAVYCGGKQLNGADVTFNGADSATVYVIVTDSRGHSTRVDVKTLSLIGYISPTIIPKITRDTPTGDTVTVSANGKWYNGSFDTVTNTLRLRVKYKIDGAADYGAYSELTVTKNGNEYTAEAKLSGLVYTNAYRFQIRLDDSVYTGGKYASDIYLSKGIPIFDWGENDFRFNVPVSLPSTTTIDGEEDPSVAATRGYVDNHISAHNQHGLVKFRAYEFTGGTAIFDSLKNNWESLPQGTFTALLKSAGGGFGCCFGFKVSNIYGAALYLSYGTGTLEFYRCVNGTWQQHNK